MVGVASMEWTNRVGSVGRGRGHHSPGVGGADTTGGAGSGGVALPPVTSPPSPPPQQQQHQQQVAKAGPGPAPPPPTPAPPIVLMKARGEEGRSGGGAGAGEGPALAPPREREGPRPTQPVYQLHGRGLPPPGALDREWLGTSAGRRGWGCGRGQGLGGVWRGGAFSEGRGQDWSNDWGAWLIVGRA